jgi:hypothetical protein
MSSNIFIYAKCYKLNILTILDRFSQQ